MISTLMDVDSLDEGLNNGHVLASSQASCFGRKIAPARRIRRNTSNWCCGFRRYPSARCPPA